MDAMEAEDLLRKLDRRMQNVEQILPALATKEDLAAAIAPLATKAESSAAIALLATKTELAPLATKAELAPLATKAELSAAIAPLATKAELEAEVREEGERTRRRFDVVAESLRDDIRLIAESQVALQAEVRQGRKDLDGILKNHEKRIARLEASDARTRTRKGR